MRFCVRANSVNYSIALVGWYVIYYIDEALGASVCNLNQFICRYKQLRIPQTRKISKDEKKILFDFLLIRIPI